MLSRLKIAGVTALVAGLFLSAGAAQAQERAAKMVAQGEFHKADKAGSGTATIWQLADGKRVLRLTKFSVDNGPDLYVRLIAARDANNTKSVAQAAHVELGKLKGNQGDQNYDMPQNVDLGKYKVVSIWCNRFHVNFAAAPLTLVKQSAAAPRN